MDSPNRKPFDLDAYIEDIQNRPCFICDMAAGQLNGNHVIYQDETCIAFLNKYPSLYGYALAAPIEHKEQVCADFTLEEYLSLQRFIYHLAEAVRLAINPERVYILSLGSQQGNRHVHWHVAPLPAGVPFKQQQLEALSIENGMLDIPEHEMAAIAQRIRGHLVSRLFPSD
ncbi:MAG: HIT family protein [Chloroflexota bacterium]|nr:MAG: HIT family protein [Chloroflexota bacterium]